MKKVLEWLGYGIGDREGKNNRAFNNFDYVLVHAYAVISLFNAISSIGTMKLFINTDSVANSQESLHTLTEYVPVIKTVLLLFVNIIILLRLNIKLSIKERTLEKDNIMKVLYGDYDNVVGVTIKALEKRNRLIRYVYVADAVVILMNMYYKSSIETSLSLIVIIPIIITWCNNLIDIAENKFSAEPKVTFALQKEDLDKILGERNQKQ